jgi:hypothetical protein
MDCDQKPTGCTESGEGPSISGAQQLRELVDFCRQQLGRDAPDSDSLFVLSVCRLSQTCGLLGDVAMARQLYQLLLPHRDRVITLVAGDTERTCAAAYFVGLVAANLSELRLCQRALGAGAGWRLGTGTRPAE